MIEVVIALCYALGAWLYSILRYYDLWKRGKVPVVFFAFLHVFSLIVVFLFETGISAMISDVVSVIMHAYSVIYGSVMILTPILCFVRGIVRFIGKKAGCSGKIYRFFNHPTKLILGFFVVTMCVGAVIFWKSRCISWEETVILQEDKKEPVKDTSIVYISNCFVGSDMTAHAFDSLVEKVNEKKPDVIAQTSRKEAKWKRLYEGQQLLNKKLKIALFAAVVLLIGFVVINFRFEYSIFTYFTNYKANMEEDLIDKYEKWEERLQQKEDSLNQ